MTDRDWSRATFKKSSHSGGNGDCVTTAKHDGVVGVQDSKLATSPTLEFSPAAIRAFLEAVKADRYKP